MYKHVLLPIDGTGRSNRAIDAGVRLAKMAGARVTGICVSETTYISQIDSGQHPLADARLAEFAKAAEALGVSYESVVIVGDSPQESIIKFATEHGCDLIVMGTHGRSRVGKFLLGSVAGTILAECEIPVLLYR